MTDRTRPLPTQVLMQPGSFGVAVSLLDWARVLRERAEPWRERAACRGRTDVDFYPHRGDTASVRAAKAVCARCPVQAECLEYAMHDEGAFPFGIWGGTSARQRRARAHKARAERMTTDGPCAAEGCHGPRQARGLCSLHYKRFKKYGTLELPEGVNSRGWEHRRATARTTARSSSERPQRARRH